MPLDKQTVNINIGGGQDAETDPHLLPLPKVVKAENLRADRKGTLVKRYPLKPVSDATLSPDLTNCWLEEANGKYLTQDDSGFKDFYGELPTTPEFRANTVESIYAGVAGDNVNRYSYWYDSGRHVVGWIEVDSGGTRRAYFSMATDGGPIRTRVRVTLNAEAYDIAVVHNNSADFYVLVTDNNGRLYRYIADFDSPPTTTTVPGTVSNTPAASNPAFLDATKQTDNEVWVVTMQENGGSLEREVHNYSSGVYSSQLVGTIGSTVRNAIPAILYQSGNNGHLFIGYRSVVSSPGTNTIVAVDISGIDAKTLAVAGTTAYDVTTASGAPATGVVSAGAYHWVSQSSTTQRLYFEVLEANAPAAGDIKWIGYLQEDTGVGAVWNQWAVIADNYGTRPNYTPLLAAAPYNIYGNINIPIVRGEGISTSQGTITVTLEDGGIVSTCGFLAYEVLGREVGGTTSQSRAVPRSFFVDNTFPVADEYYICYPAGTNLESGYLGDEDQLSSYSTLQWRVAKFSSGTQLDIPTTRLQEGVFVGGAAPKWHDGTLAIDLHPNDGVKFDTEVNAAATPPTGNYTAGAGDNLSIELMTVYFDSQNNQKRYVSVPVSIGPLNAADTVSFLIPTHDNSWLDGYTAITTQARAFVGDLTLYSQPYFWSDPSNAGFTPRIWLMDDGAVDPVVSHLASGELDPAAFPPTSASASFNNQLWVVDAENRDIVYRTKPFVEGIVPEVSIELVENVGRKITGLAVMDSKLMVFFEDGMGFFSGNGEDTFGNGSGYKFQLLPDTTGPTDTRSIVEFPGGVMYERDGKFYRLLRNMTLQPDSRMSLDIGETVTSSYYWPGDYEVRFTTNTRQYVYNAEYDIWTTHKNSLGYLVGNVTTAGGSSLPTYFLNGASQLPQYEGVTTVRFNANTDPYNSQVEDFFLDRDAFAYGSTVTTGWVSMSNLVGYSRLSRIEILGHYFNQVYNGSSIVSTDQTSGLTLKLAYDYDQTVVDTFTWTATELRAIANGDRLQLRVVPSIQKIQSFQATIEETQESTADGSPGFAITGLGLRVGVKGPLYKKLPTGANR